MSTSLVINPSIVHMFGWIIPEPLHIPPTVTVFPPISISTAASFFSVSVVMMAFAASRPASRLPSSFGAMAFTPFAIRSIGSCIPMTPVDATSTLSSGIPRLSDAALAVSLQ